jgi:phosphohistidine swiveling domain-containing protein
MKKVEKIISRDISVIGMYADHVGLTKGLKEWLGWSYSDLIFYFHEDYSDLMLPFEEHYTDYLDFVIKKIRKDRRWFVIQHDRFLKLTQEFYDFFDKSKKRLDKEVSNEEIMKIYNRFYGWMRIYYGIFVLMKWFPIWLENKTDLNKEYNHEVKMAMDARKKAELILPLGREIMSMILDQCKKYFPFDHSLMQFITKKELFDMLIRNKTPHLEDLQKRKSGFIFSRKGISLTNGKPNKAKRILEKLGYGYEVSSYEDLEMFKGQSACKGKIRGIVRLIMTNKEIQNIQEGEILVTSMTTPEYVPAMKKAAAFVTDEGGITCHAAIVAREMKKPCIIGTKIATKSLKDGDYVEVDANTGIIRKIDQ